MTGQLGRIISKTWQISNDAFRQNIGAVRYLVGNFSKFAGFPELGPLEVPQAANMLGFAGQIPELQMSAVYELPVNFLNAEISYSADGLIVENQMEVEWQGQSFYDSEPGVMQSMDLGPS